ncbi:hypothetical protein EVAR_56032_1 [Eumeta japonica]|uniref:Uncharacterized protein n=1 Tax=Eumeta variegata TaxID=151549 RepID=A0A4C1YM35_EUMVA|nr:hypothetical protein EVAR_56032_1 [Eumeta japonica]
MIGNEAKTPVLALFPKWSYSQKSNEFHSFDFQAKEGSKRSAIEVQTVGQIEDMVRLRGGRRAADGRRLGCNYYRASIGPPGVFPCEMYAPPAIGRREKERKVLFPDVISLVIISARAKYSKFPNAPADVITPIRRRRIDSFHAPRIRSAKIIL